MQNLILEYDDLHPNCNEDCIDLIDTLIERYPSIHLSFFTIPVYPDPFSDSVEWCNRIRKHIENNNVTLGLHGFYHSQEEFKNISFEDALLKISVAEKIFKLAGFPKPICFRGPHWGINQETYDALIEKKYLFVYSHEDYKHYELHNKDKIETIFYNHNLKDDLKKNCSDVIIAHGHTHNVCQNGIEETLSNVVSFIDSNPDLKFLSINSIGIY